MNVHVFSEELTPQEIENCVRYATESHRNYLEDQITDIDLRLTKDDKIEISYHYNGRPVETISKLFTLKDINHCDPAGPKGARGGHDNSKAIYTRDIACRIVEQFEDVLDKNDVKIPSPEDDERGEDNEACLYGSVYSDLLDSVEEDILDTLLKFSTHNTVISGIFSGNT